MNEYDQKHEKINNNQESEATDNIWNRFLTTILLPDMFLHMYLSLCKGSRSHESVTLIPLCRIISIQDSF